MTGGMRGLVARKGPSFGHYIGEFTTPGIGYVLKEAGCDFAWLDMEHSGNGFETVHRTLRYFEAAELPAIVRVPSDAYDHVARALDVGAEAIAIPMLGSAAQAEAVVERMKYTPQGRRGVALGLANDRYHQGPVVPALAAANARTVLVALIETRSGIEQVDAIAATPGIDVLWVGHFDLSCDLGLPGAFDHPTYQAAVARVRKAAKKHGKVLGSMAGSVEDGITQVKDGCGLVMYAGDVWLLQAAIRDGLRAIRAGVATQKSGKATAKGKKAKGA